MGIIRYKSEETGRIWEYIEGNWYCTVKGQMRKISEATFYERGGDKQKLIRYVAKKMKAKGFLSNGDNPEDILCKFAHIYFPINVRGQRKIMRTGRLEKIIT